MSLNAPLREEVAVGRHVLRLTRVGGRGRLPIASIDLPERGDEASFRLGRAVRLYEAMRDWGEPKLLYVSARTDPVLRQIIDPALVLMGRP